MQGLLKDDLNWILRSLPRPALRVLTKHPGQVFLAGGFIRARVSGEKPSDVDLLACSEEMAKTVAHEIAQAIHGDNYPEHKIHTTPNAYTIRHRRLPIQVIKAWTYATPIECVLSFDFSICQAAVWWTDATEVPKMEAGWQSCVTERFYADLAARRLVYQRPLRSEMAGGSLLRVLKFYQRGYRIPLDSLAGVIVRMLTGVRWEEVTTGGVGIEWTKLEKVIAGLLYEVDPNADMTNNAFFPSQRDAEPPTKEEVDGGTADDE